MGRLRLGHMSRRFQGKRTPVAPWSFNLGLRYLEVLFPSSVVTRSWSFLLVVPLLNSPISLFPLSSPPNLTTLIRSFWTQDSVGLTHWNLVSELERLGVTGVDVLPLYGPRWSVPTTLLRTVIRDGVSVTR